MRFVLIFAMGILATTLTATCAAKGEAVAAVAGAIGEIGSAIGEIFGPLTVAAAEAIGKEHDHW